MKRYRILIEGSFVAIDGCDSALGFFTTVHISASNSAHAIEAALHTLVKSMNSSKISIKRHGVDRSLFYICEITETDIITTEEPPGFNFYPINKFTRIALLAKNTWLRIVDSKRLISI